MISTHLTNNTEKRIIPTQIGHDTYTYDANGNPTLVVNDSTNQTREMYWDEENRLMVLSDNGKTSRYTYNAAGERIVKSHGTMEGVYINGAPQGITFNETDEFTLYPASIMSVNKTRFTKHYFIGSQRIASKIGTGTFNNVYGINGSRVTAGQQDYAARMQQIESQKEEYYKKLGIAPGVPTEKGAYGDPENTGVGYNTVITELGDHSVPEGWVQTPKTNTTTGSTAGAPISWNDPTNPEDATAGYGFIADDTTDVEDIYFFHSDHLGSTSYVTDKKGNITQYDAYLPYGELLVDEHSSSEDMPYKFNGKEMDEETGLYYYGARYMNPVTSLWYGVDPLAEKYAGVSGYIYTLDNPVKLVDYDGAAPSKSAFIKVSKLMGVGVAEIRAVYETETQGSTFDTQGRIKILFERHYFSKYTNHRFDKKYPKISNPVQGGYGKFSEQYEKFEQAVKLDKDAAYKSISYGAFQIMGANYEDAGFSSAQQFGDAMFKGNEDEMVMVFAKYIMSDKLKLKYLKSHNWAGFAKLYNGLKYKKNKYDEKMRDNYNNYKNEPLRGLTDHSSDEAKQNVNKKN